MWFLYYIGLTQKQTKAISPFRTDDLRKIYYAYIRHGCSDCMSYQNSYKSNNIPIYIK